MAEDDKKKLQAKLKEQFDNQVNDNTITALVDEIAGQVGRISRNGHLVVGSEHSWPMHKIGQELARVAPQAFLDSSDKIKGSVDAIAQYAGESTSVRINSSEVMAQIVNGMNSVEQYRLNEKQKQVENRPQPMEVSRGSSVRVEEIKEQQPVKKNFLQRLWEKATGLFSFGSNSKNDGVQEKRAINAQKMQVIDNTEESKAKNKSDNNVREVATNNEVSSVNPKHISENRNQTSIPKNPQGPSLKR